MKTTPAKLADALRLVALEANANAERIDAAAKNLDAASGPLRASGGGGAGGGIADPTFAALGASEHDTGIVADSSDQATRDRARLDRLVLQQFQASAGIAKIIDEWAPDAEKQARLRGTKIDNESLWCPNHLAHGMHEPRDTARHRRLCRFCDDFQRENRDPNTGQGLLPNRWLLDYHARHGKVTSRERDKAVADILAERAAAKKAAKAARKAKAS